MDKIDKIGIILGMIMLTVCGFMLGNCYGYKEAIPLLNAYDDYNKKCETLLDSIAAWDLVFMNTTSVTNVYYDYLESREKLDKILYN